MSDIYGQRNLRRGLEQTRVKEIPALYLPWTQRVLNPFPLASSGGVWGDMAQPWAVNLLAFYVEVFVSTTNNGSNYWELKLINSDNTSDLAVVTTSAIAANAWVRLSQTSSLTQPASSNPVMSIKATAAGSPGAIYIAPAVALLRTG